MQVLYLLDTQLVRGLKYVVPLFLAVKRSGVQVSSAPPSFPQLASFLV